MRGEHEIRAGIFIVAGLFLGMLAIFVLGQERQIFADQEEFLATFSDVKGLAEGAPVRLGGIAVGRVAKIGFSPNTLDGRVYVNFLVNEEYLDRLNFDSVVTIETQGLLGDRFLSITRGKERRLLPPGGTMQSDEPADIAQVLNKAGQVVDNTVEISNNMNDFFKLLRGETLTSFNSAAASVAELSKEIEKGDGLIHRLIYSKKDGDQIIGNLRGASEGISEIVAEIKGGKGALHALIYDPAGAKSIDALTSAAANLSSTMEIVNDILTEVKTGSGFLHELIYAESKGSVDDVIAKLNVTADNLKRASEALAQGSGTLGALLLDPHLYDNLVEVTDEAKRSYLLRQAIRSSLDK